MMLTLGLLTACISNYYGADPDHPKEFPNTERMNDEPKQGNDANYYPDKDYLQSDEKGVGQGGIENNFYENDEAREISQYLAKKEDVMQYYVAPFDDRVVITVEFRDPHEDIENRGKELQDDISQLTPDKDVIVYTDEYSWNQMNQIKAGNAQREAGESAEEFIERMFNVDIKD